MPRQGALAEELSTALGVDAPRVRAVLGAYRVAERARRSARRSGFADALAQKLGLPADEVRAALAAMPERRTRAARRSHARPPLTR
jgi:hypothetical protein